MLSRSLSSNLRLHSHQRDPPPDPKSTINGEIKRSAGAEDRCRPSYFTDGIELSWVVSTDDRIRGLFGDLGDYRKTSYPCQFAVDQS